MPVAVASCAGEYRPATVAFHESASATTVAMAQSSATIRQLGVQVRRDIAIETPAAVRIRQGDCETSSDRCRLQFVSTAGAPPELLPPSEPLEQIVTLARAIEAYAATLQAIAEADTATEVEAAVTAAGGAVTSLAQTASALGRGPGEAIVSYSEPVTALLAWGFGEYVNSAQLRALRAATAAAEGEDPETGPIAQAAALFSEALGRSQVAMAPTFREAVTQRREAFLARPTNASFDAMVEAAAAFDGLLTASASTIPSDLRTAHRALYESLLTDEVQSLTDFFAAVERIKTRAEELLSVIEQLAALQN